MMKMLEFEHEFFSLAKDWLACRLAMLGGTPLSPQHRPVRSFDTFAWALLGCHDYAFEMRLLCQMARDKISK